MKNIRSVLGIFGVFISRSLPDCLLYWLNKKITYPCVALRMRKVTTAMEENITEGKLIYAEIQSGEIKS